MGLTATPDRADGESILEDFKNVAHKLDSKEAVELGEGGEIIEYASLQSLIKAEDIEENLWRDARSLFCCNTDDDITDFINRKAVE